MTWMSLRRGVADLSPTGTECAPWGTWAGRPARPGGGAVVPVERGTTRTMASKPSGRFYHPGTVQAPAVGRAPQADRPGEAARPARTPVPAELYAAAGAAVLLATVVWAFWPSLCEFARAWRNDPQYSHGYLVPGF